jgi:cysteine-rich repeat protein
MRAASLLSVTALFLLTACPVPDYTYPPGPPRIDLFTASPFAVKPGDPVSISWSVTGADDVELDGAADGPHTMIGASGSLSMRPTAPLALRLVATGAGGRSEADASVQIVGGAVVQLLSFTADKSLVEPLEPVTLSWSTSDATFVSLDLGTGEIIDGAPSSGETVIHSTVDFTARIRVEGDGGPLEGAVSVRVRLGAPIIDEFKVSPRFINPSQNAVLTWTVERATQLALTSFDSSGLPSEIPVPDPPPQSGSIFLDANTGTATITLTVSNESGIASESTILYVVPGSDPLIVDFTATPTITGPHGDVLLRWETRFADSVSLEVGGSTVMSNLDASGSTTIHLDATSTVDLIAKSAVGHATDWSRIVTIDPLRPQLTAVATPSIVPLGQSTSISWSGSGFDNLYFKTDMGALVFATTDPSGSFPYTPALSVTLIAHAVDAAGETQVDLPLLVGAQPQIVAFSASSTIARFGRPIDLAWRTQGATRGDLSTAFGLDVPIGSEIAQGARRILAGAPGSTSVTLSASSTFFSASQMIALSVLFSSTNAAEAEPNDVEATAEGRYQTPSVVSGVLTPADVDMFAVSIPGGSRLHVTTASAGSCPRPIAADVYEESDFEPLGAASLVFAPQNGCAEISALLDARVASLGPNVLIALRHPAGDLASTAPYQLAISFDPAICGDHILDRLEECDDGNRIDGDGCSSLCTVEGLDEVEPNDDFSTANSIRVPTAMRAFLDVGDADFYTFTLTQADQGMLTVTLASPAAGMCDLGARLSLYSADRTLLAQTSGGGCPMIGGAASVLSPGAYFISVTPVADSALPTKGLYRLTITMP